MGVAIITEVMKWQIATSVFCPITSSLFMIKFLEANITHPPLNQGWQTVPLGFSNLMLRFISYGTILLFFIVNGLCLHYFGFSYLQDFVQTVGSQPVRILSTICIFIALYFVIHEIIHVAFHPDHGFSKRTMAGAANGTIFVVYNGEVSSRRMYIILLAPLLTLTVVLSIFFYCNPNINQALMVNTFGMHFSACFGDLALLFQLRKTASKTMYWNSVSVAWAK
ncbi:DUF3267 domain-containing protein [Undibacterium crateris]|uniref:DUF3267 domain-containing protein n=1 Tax=Undibacterium crateris TaxID=2528175 RepID=UPI0013899A8D|nr:DUF3267 domain-containing protein [Undibacterium crateris]NDI86404.1 hypothetical protein [Undibacterium crateris]